MQKHRYKMKTWRQKMSEKRDYLEQHADIIEEEYLKYKKHIDSNITLEEYAEKWLEMVSCNYCP